MILDNANQKKSPKQIIKRLRRKNKRILSDLKFVVGVNKVLLLISCILFIFGVVKTIQYRSLSLKMNSLASKYDVMMNEYNDMKESYKYIRTEIDNFSDNTSKMLMISEELDAENQRLVSENRLQKDLLDEFVKREELYNKYDYAIIDKKNSLRTDITYDQILTLDKALEDADVNDIDLLLAIVMTESKGIEKAQNNNSSASGYGQLLNSTARHIYVDLMGNENYDSSIALNGTTNLIMMSKYIDELYNSNGKDLLRAINSYRGIHDSGYINSINRYLAYSNKSINSINLNLKN